VPGMAGPGASRRAQVIGGRDARGRVARRTVPLDGVGWAAARSRADGPEQTAPEMAVSEGCLWSPPSFKLRALVILWIRLAEKR
jgi:hypothetical protein